MSNDDDIPVLSEVIFPGKPEKIRERLASDLEEEEKPEPTVSEQIAQTSSEGLNVVTPEPDVSFIKDEINDIIETVLQRHLAEAREEIVTAVMKELYSRLE